MDTETHVRLERTRKIPSRLVDYELLHDSAVTIEGELILFALLDDVKPTKHDGTMKSKV